MRQNRLILYIDKAPPFEGFEEFKTFSRSDLTQVMESGNHWRKIINIFAKLAFGLNSKDCGSWQEYRDRYLLRDGDEIILVNHQTLIEDSGIHLICGKNQFESMDLEEAAFQSLDTEGKVRVCENVIQTPYFDYRQFPNKLIDELVQYLHKF